MGSSTKRRYPLFLLLFFCLTPTPAHAVSLGLAAGGRISSPSITHPSGSSVFLCPGYDAGLWARFKAPLFDLPLTVELHFLLLREMGANTNETAGETFTRSGYAGGFDVGLRSFFLGLQYNLNTSRISTSSMTTELDYRTIELRTGWTFPLTEAGGLSLSVGLAHEFPGSGISRNSSGVESAFDLSENYFFGLFRLAII